MPINNIRNIAFVGQTGTGKTTLVEKLLFTCDATHHLGSVEKGDTVTDFDPNLFNINIVSKQLLSRYAGIIIA